MGHFDDDVLFTPPTRECLICNELENPNAGLVDGGAAWLCDDCKTKLRKLLGVDSDG